MSHKLITKLPCKHDRADWIDVKVNSVRVLDRAGHCDAWHKQVKPVVAKIEDRADRTWNWPLLNLALRAAAPTRRPRLLQLLVGPELRPAAMLALLASERWIDGQPPSVFLWYVAAAPDSCLRVTTRQGRTDCPGLVGQAALDTALVISLRGDAKGRLWLHADPEGGAALPRWYALSAACTLIPDRAFPFLPGDIARGERTNDSRYFAFTHETAVWAYQRFSAFRE